MNSGHASFATPRGVEASGRRNTSSASTVLDDDDDDDDVADDRDVPHPPIAR